MAGTSVMHVVVEMVSIVSSALLAVGSRLNGDREEHVDGEIRALWCEKVGHLTRQCGDLAFSKIQGS